MSGDLSTIYYNSLMFSLAESVKTYEEYDVID